VQLKPVPLWVVYPKKRVTGLEIKRHASTNQVLIQVTLLSRYVQLQAVPIRVTLFSQKPATKPLQKKKVHISQVICNSNLQVALFSRKCAIKPLRDDLHISQQKCNRSKQVALFSKKCNYKRLRVAHFSRNVQPIFKTSCTFLQKRGTGFLNELHFSQ
jgi:hypothetical protein